MFINPSNVFLHLNEFCLIFLSFSFRTPSLFSEASSMYDGKLKENPIQYLITMDEVNPYVIFGSHSARRYIFWTVKQTYFITSALLDIWAPLGTQISSTAEVIKQTLLHRKKTHTLDCTAIYRMTTIASICVYEIRLSCPGPLPSGCFPSCTMLIGDQMGCFPYNLFFRR